MVLMWPSGTYIFLQLQVRLKIDSILQTKNCDTVILKWKIRWELAWEIPNIIDSDKLQINWRLDGHMLGQSYGSTPPTILNCMLYVNERIQS